MRRIISALFTVFALTAVGALAADWPQFRGPAGNGVSTEKSAPVFWSADENVRWKAPLPGPGNSSPIVSRGRVFVTCAQDKGRNRSLYCFDRTDGRQLWVRTVEFNKQMPTHKTNPFCGSTPVADGERVVVWHGSAGLYCYDIAGKQLWSRDLGEVNHIWGYASSPVIYKDRIFLNRGPGNGTAMMALELDSGKILWNNEEPFDGEGSFRADKKYSGTWSTPIVVKVDVRDQVVCAMPTRVNAYDPADGRIIWSCEGLSHGSGSLAYSSPMISGKLCVTIGGFRGPGIGFTIGGSGDITKTNRIWRIEKQPQSIGTGVFVGEHLYRANAGPGTIECLDPRTGEVLWTDRADGGNHWGSIVMAAGRLYVTNQEGTTVVFRPNPDKFDRIASNELGESCNTTPAVSFGQMFIRTDKGLYCIDDSAAE